MDFTSRGFWEPPVGTSVFLGRRLLSGSYGMWHGM